MYPDRFARSLRSLATLAPLARYARSLALVLRSSLAPLARCARSLALVLRSPLAPLARCARSLALVLRAEFAPSPLPTRFARGAGWGRGAPPSLRAAPAPPRRFAPLGLAPAPRPIAARPLAAAVPAGRAGFASGSPRSPRAPSAVRGQGLAAPSPVLPPAGGYSPPIPLAFCRWCALPVQPSSPPPTPPNPLARPEGEKPTRKGNPSGRARSPKGAPIGRTPKRIAPTLKGIAVGGRLAASLQPSPTLFVGYRIPIRIGMTRCLLPLSPLASANKFVAALRRYGVAGGPASPRIGATARRRERGPGSPLDSFSFVCCLSIPLQNRCGVSSSLFGCRGCSGSSPPLPFSGSCKRSHRCA